MSEVEKVVGDLPGGRHVVDRHAIGAAVIGYSAEMDHRNCAAVGIALIEPGMGVDGYEKDAVA
jgi:hypothetical protein